MPDSHGSPQLVWLRYACDCPFPQGRSGKVVRRLQSGKYLVENASGFVALFRASDLTFDRS